MIRVPAPSEGMRRTRLLSGLSLVLAISFSCGDTGEEPSNPDGGGAGEPSGSGGSQAGSSGAGSGAVDGGVPNRGGEGGSAAIGGAGVAGSGGERPCAVDVTSSLSSGIGTVGIVEWSADQGDIETARIEFGLDTTYGMSAPVDLTEANQRTLLLGMKASRTYHFRIVVEGPSESCSSEDFTLTTGPLPDDLRGVTLTKHDAGTPAGGFFVSGFLQDGPAFILDADGDYVWWYGAGEMGRAAMSHDGKFLWYAGINVNGGRASMKRVTMDGLREDDFTDEFGEIHHDFTVLPDESIAFIQHDGPLDRVVERAPDGALSVIFDLASAHGGASMNHANSIHYSPDDDAYTVSDLSQDAYVKVTRQGEVVWVLGGSTSDFSGDGAVWEAQHGHHLLAEDRLLFFSNGPFQGPSTVIEVALDFSTKTATRVWEYVSGERSVLYGDVRRLANGNTLVTYSSFGIVHEVSPNGELIEELIFEPPGGIGYATKRASLYGRPPE